MCQSNLLYTVLKHMSLPLQAKATVAVADADLYTQEQQVCLHINIHILALDRGLFTDMAGECSGPLPDSQLNLMHACKDEGNRSPQLLLWRPTANRCWSAKVSLTVLKKRNPFLLFTLSTVHLSFVFLEITAAHSASNWLPACMSLQCWRYLRVSWSCASMHAERAMLKVPI